MVECPMKKTTLYLEDSELEQLKRKAFLLNTSVAELIRKLVTSLLASKSTKEEKALRALAKLRAEFSDETDKEIMGQVIQIQRDIRNVKKAKSRH